MIRANPKDCVVRKQISRVEFGFYTDEDVRGRSVCEITSNQALDAVGTQLPNGLYDPRMGPAAAQDPPCATCACQFLTCPGHFGHIELCVPVYQPLLFDKLLLMLRVKCWNCHKLKAANRVLEVIKLKLKLILVGQYSKALEVDEMLAAATKTRTEADGKSTVRAAVAAIDSTLKEIANSISGMKMSSQPPSTHEQALHRELVTDLFATCKQAKSCPHCGAYSPKIRQDSSNKIFQSPLSETAKRVNEAEVIKLRPALSHKQKVGDDASDSDEDDNNTEQQNRDTYLHPSEVQAQIQLTWKTDDFLCRQAFALQGHQIFFLQAIAVPPNRFRPPMHLGGMVVEHSQNVYLSRVVTANELVRSTFTSGSESQGYKHWIDLQTQLNCFIDSSKDPGNNPNAPTGIRQLLERKEGIFRKHMMGKRVDYACRSVISPDPYVGTNEIGIPRHFAINLTYPTPVTDINVDEMRRLVERGPDDYPGARWIQFPERRVDLGKMDKHKREAAAARLLVYVKKGGQPAIVGRQLRDGDMVLMNRQPTLHKPGIMAHEVRVLHNPTQKTIRMHYANCNTYNADFDGDEMNCHFPQSDLGRAEAEYIAKTDLQFIVPTDGSPLRGLIQDHVVAGVKLTKRDTFLQKWEYQQLLFAALASLPRLELIRSDEEIELLPPTIRKPKELWTGKQVISTLLRHLAKGNDRDHKGATCLPGISTARKTKTPGSAFGDHNEEHLVIIRDGELLRGVLDKAAFGATDFCLVHAVFEAYGPEKAGLLLNSLGRLFTAYLQFYAGHSCRMEDLILTKEADEARRKLVNEAYLVGSRSAKAWADSEGGKVSIVVDESNTDEQLKPVEAASAAFKLRTLLSGNEGKENASSLDGFMMSKLNPLASKIVKRCLPNGLAVPFPKNTFGIMVTTGAKGSIVNQSQVSCALGQQALEGRRVPRMSSGRTLPSFAPYDINPRADGFVMDRFLTGIRPQEYYFHCMAGREGLVDTAVKTSRSGYLQRCLVKHLEELKVCYDYTVRNGEGGVVQFLYGEDGLDPTLASYLDCTDKSFEFMARNHDALRRRQIALPGPSIETAAGDAKRYEEVRSDDPNAWKAGDHVRARRLRFGTSWERGSLCLGWYDAVIVKVHDTKRITLDIKYSKDGKVEKRVPVKVDFGKRGNALSSTSVLIEASAPDPILSSVDRGSRVGSTGNSVSEKVAISAIQQLNQNKSLKKAMRSHSLSRSQFGSLVAAKFSSALCAPGEAVGSIAAQSVGEPSTQMTLNTFHLAGAGANVTLGIPRLREIIMTASQSIKTPTMSVPLDPSISKKDAIKLTRSFTRLTLNELIKGSRGVVVREALECNDGGEWERTYKIVISFHPAERIEEAFGLSLAEIATVVSNTFVPNLENLIKSELRRSATGDEKSISISGADQSNLVHSERSEEASVKQNKVEKTDPLDSDDDDDDTPEDGSNSPAVDEDGVAANKTQRDGYDSERDEDSPVSEKEKKTSKEASDGSSSSDDDSSSGEGSDSDKSSAPDSDEPRRDNAIAKSNIVEDKNAMTLDKASNAIHLQALCVDPAARPLLMVGLVEQAAKKTVVKCRKNVEQAFINDEEGRGRCLQTAGVNFEEIWKLDIVDHNKLMSNDIWAMRTSYGVEAARNNLVEQIRSVFGAYGIEVDSRHLTLIADYMTYSGGYTPLNRIGMKTASSPFLQMSFETTAQFLTQAALTGTCDNLDSPSSNIVVGRPIRHGTGAFSLLVK